MDDWNDVELFAKMKEGSKEALATLFVRHYDYLKHFGYKNCTGFHTCRRLHTRVIYLPF